MAQRRFHRCRARFATLQAQCPSGILRRKKPHSIFGRIRLWMSRMSSHAKLAAGARRRRLLLALEESQQLDESEVRMELSVQDDSLMVID